MGTVKVVRLEDTGCEAHGYANPTFEGDSGPLHGRQEVRTYFEGTESSPFLIEVRAGADKPTISHAHRVDEIVYILDGELRIGKHTYGPGSAILVPGDTLYSFHVGPEGVRYLNFRPRRDDSYVTAEQFMAERRARHEAVEVASPD